MPKATSQPERVTVTVEAPKSHPDVLSVEDAMNQVRDAFVLLQASTEGDDSVIWRLISATTRSPLTVVGEATSRDPKVPFELVEAVARAQKRAFTDNLQAVRHGKRPIAWESGRASTAMTEMLRRTLNGIGSVSVELEAGRSVIIDTSVAISALEQLEKKSTFVPGFRKHIERGAVEGTLSQIFRSHNTQPAIKVRERGTGLDVVCIVSPDVKDRIEREIGPADVWEKHRITVYGMLQYGDDGRVTRINADDVKVVIAPKIMLDEIIDPDFTGGVDSVEYLRQFHEGELG